MKLWMYRMKSIRLQWLSNRYMSRSSPISPSQVPFFKTLKPTWHDLSYILHILVLYTRYIHEFYCIASYSTRWSSIHSYKERTIRVHRSDISYFYKFRVATRSSGKDYTWSYRIKLLSLKGYRQQGGRRWKEVVQRIYILQAIDSRVWYKERHDFTTQKHAHTCYD
jgi:hypothetical protein